MNIYIPTEEQIASMRFEGYVPSSDIPKDAVFYRGYQPFSMEWTPEMRAEQSKRIKAQGNAWVNNGATEAARIANTGAKRSKACKEAIRKAAINRPIKECPHCGKQSTSNNIWYYHFDNCKYKSS